MFIKLLLASTLAAVTLSAHAATDLPDACGKPDIKFDVKTEKNPPPLPPSFEGNRARIVFISSWHSNSATIGPKPTSQFGIDGKWVGAAKGDSYFVVEVDAGEHHLCAIPQSRIAIKPAKYLALSSFTAEPGKTYFYQFQFNSIVTGTGSDTTTEFTSLNDDEGNYRIRKFPLATWTVNP